MFQKKAQKYTLKGPEIQNFLKCEGHIDAVEKQQKTALRYNASTMSMPTWISMAHEVPAKP